MTEKTVPAGTSLCKPAQPPPRTALDILTEPSTSPAPGGGRNQHLPDVCLTTFPQGRERAHSIDSPVCLFLKPQCTCRHYQHWSTSEQLLWHLPHSPAPPLPATPQGSVTCGSTAAETQTALYSNGERACEAGGVTQATHCSQGTGGHNCHCHM